MRIAKQNRSDSIMENAMKMAANRNNNLLNQINDNTSNSLLKTVQVNREMGKNQVLNETTHSRKHRFISKNGNFNEAEVDVSESRRANNNVRKTPSPSNNGRTPISKNTVNRRNHNIRKPTQTRHDRRNVNNSGKIYEYPGKPVQASKNIHARNGAKVIRRPVNNTKEVSAGLSTNAAEETRRRRKLEAIIRERANIN